MSEGELLATRNVVTGDRKYSQRYLEAITMGIEAPDYQNIKIPALGIYAVDTSSKPLMKAWYDPHLKATVEALFLRQSEREKEQISRFSNEVPNSEVLILEDADHAVFINTHEKEVLEAITRFINANKIQ